MVLAHSLACQILASKRRLRAGVALLRGLAVPLSGLAQIPRRAPAAKMRLAHRELRHDVAMLGENSHHRELGFENLRHFFRLGEFVMVEGSIITLHCYALSDL